MREIKFRGKNAKGEWVYGDLLHNRGETFIAPDGIQSPFAKADDFRVDPATVGQFTGLHDKNGKEIWEGDIVYLLGKTPREIIFREGVFGYATLFPDNTIALGLNYNFKWRNEHSGVVEVADNVHDNPELLNDKN